MAMAKKMGCFFSNDAQRPTRPQDRSDRYPLSSPKTQNTETENFFPKCGTQIDLDHSPAWMECGRAGMECGQCQELIFSEPAHAPGWSAEKTIMRIVANLPTTTYTEK